MMERVADFQAQREPGWVKTGGGGIREDGSGVLRVKILARGVGRTAATLQAGRHIAARPRRVNRVGTAQSAPLNVRIEGSIFLG